MGVAKAQLIKVEKVCQCGCGQTFSPFPVYKKGIKGLTYPIYIRGHHPKCRENQTSNKPAWNKGLTKIDHESIEKMGFQVGHKPFNDFSKIHQLQRNDSEYRKKWLASKRKQVPWNKGLTGKEYPNGIKKGKDHGNWCGNTRGVNDLSEMKKLKSAAMKRDNYTCQKCGDRNHPGRGSRCRLEIHHIISIAENRTLALDVNNLTTLCNKCHRETDNYGTKVVRKLRNQSGK